MVSSLRLAAVLALSLFSKDATAGPIFRRAPAEEGAPKAIPNGTDAIVFTNTNGLGFMHMNASLPNITIFATGGTIAGSDSDPTATAGYKAGAVGVQVLIDAVPAILDKANVAGIQVSNVASEDVSSQIQLNISRQINELVCNDPSMAGAVVTHGTDTLEETAFFLDATVNCSKPVVVVGAMRPSTAISADGPYNLLEAVTVAASPLARDRGAMVVMNDRIVSAYYVTKTNANTMDTFKAFEMGNLGQVISDNPFFFFPPAFPTGRHVVDVADVTEIPRVDIHYADTDMPADLLEESIAHGAKGIVVAGAGAGGVPSAWSKAASSIMDKKDLPFIYSFRTGSGEVPGADTSGKGIASGYLNPQKARILLELCLAKGYSTDEIREVFRKGTD
ncbi:hypothetical protein KEM52_000287 [Ascosphaera acerosa]|nr:hypothetical protein KEM52_000287 [Ascosphaera acerosa]